MSDTLLFPTLTAPTTAGQVIDLFLLHTRRSQAERTYLERERILRAFQASHGGLSLAESKPFHLRLWIDGHEEWTSDWTRKGAVATVQRAFNWAAKLGMIQSNPFCGVSNPEGESGRPMTDAEFSAMLRASSAPFRRVLIFLRFTGCRPCELRSLHPEHLDLDQGIALLKEHKTARTRRDRKPRVLVLHPAAVALLRSLLRTMIPEQRYLFINSRGRPWTRYALSCRLKRLRQKLGLAKDCRLYGLRYKLACQALRAKLDLKTLSVLLGHTDVRTTQKYARIDGDLDHLASSMKQIFQIQGRSK